MQHEEDRERLAALPEEIASRVLNAQKRRRGEERSNPAAKRAYLGWNRERARACVEEDYTGARIQGFGIETLSVSSEYRGHEPRK